MAKTAYSPIGYLCFPHLFSPHTNPQNPAQGPRYSAIFLFDETGVQTSAYQDLRQLVMDAIVEKFGATKAQDPNFVQTLRLPFRPAAEKSYGGFEKGQVFISPWSNATDKSGTPVKAPGVVNLNGDPMVPTDVWPGQLARALLTAFAYDSNGNKGVSFGLQHVQIVKADMPRLDGRVSEQEAFKDADNSQLAALGITLPGSSVGGNSLGGVKLPF